MFRPEIRRDIWALILMAAGGLLLHLRIHPPAEDTLYWVPALFGATNILIVPFLFNSVRGVVWAYAFTLLTVSVGIFTMSWYSVAEWTGPVTLLGVVLKATLADSLILAARIPIAHNILLFYQRASDRAERRPRRGEHSADRPVLLGATPGDGRAELIPSQPMGRAHRTALATVLSLLALAFVAVSIAIGTQGYPRLAGHMGASGAALLVAGRGAGMAAAMLLMLQFVLSARIRLLDRVFGLDRLLVAHKYAGVIAAVLATAHPVLLAAGGRPEAPTPAYDIGEKLGFAAAILLYLVVVTSLWRALMRMPYESWRRTHWVAFAIVGVVSIHSLAIGSDVTTGWARWFWIGCIAAYAVLFIWAKLIRPPLVRARRWVVEGVQQLTHDTWHLTLSPRDGRPLCQVPGQFCFLTLHRESGPAQQHPFTISTSPTSDGRIGFTIKESGDFTNTIGETRPGDMATIEGPFGLFSHLARCRDGRPLVMIAGGVGITPMLSMLRFMAANSDPRRIVLIWGNKTEADIIARNEFERLAERLPGLVVHHVLSEQDDFDGERGLINAELLGRLLGEEDLAGDIFICGPIPMMTRITSSLRALGVASSRIHTERFSFA